MGAGLDLVAAVRAEAVTLAASAVRVTRLMPATVLPAGSGGSSCGLASPHTPGGNRPSAAAATCICDSSGASGTRARSGVTSARPISIDDGSEPSPIGATPSPSPGIAPASAPRTRTTVSGMVEARVSSNSATTTNGCALVPSGVGACVPPEIAPGWLPRPATLASARAAPPAPSSRYFCTNSSQPSSRQASWQGSPN
jgi:hypothetical protein